MGRPMVTLTTDFGLRDPYVAEMKAVILGICSNAMIVDISHQIEKFSVRMGAFVLASASPYFPEGTVHVAVIDPRVGTRRRALCIKTKHSFFIGPDNGVLVLAAKAQGIEQVYEISNRKFMLPKVSNTFHGRDVFSPAAAHLANGTIPSDFGPQTEKMVIPDFAKVVREKDRLVGEVIHVDDFGNIITNIRSKDLNWMKTGKVIKVKVKNRGLTMKFCSVYAEVGAKKPLALIGSHGFLEISVNQGNASRAFRVKSGDKVTFYRS